VGIKLWQWCGERVDLSGFNAFENRPTRYVLKAAKACAQGHGTLSQSARTRDRHGNVGIRVV
jgi:hypothetical protein